MSNPELKEEGKTINFEIVKRPTFKCHETASNSSEESHSHHQDQEKKEEENEGEEQRRVEEFEVKKPEEAAVASSSLRSEKEEEELEDGFRTPTSLYHRIPVAKQCPPAPRKPKASRKRKQPASQNTRSSCRHPLDFSKEVEFDLLFPTIQHNPLSDSNQNAKKARREDPK
ncbi:hypothetical protein L6164_000489 [Bauhinia variegata]|uniref:Uncharacterized protein n=1 Tax=Bauhinia variegata TaxID=167791 RepID=A0ACB9Q6M3_BAUVA|nr:hypothetical protein L6164_000489 [Bauhinia variegata]